MLLNYIWIGFFIASFLVALFRTFGYIFRGPLSEYLGISFGSADAQVFNNMLDSTFKMAETSIDISIYLIGVMTLWLGIMRIGEKGGAIQLLGKITAPFFSRLFPELPKNHPAHGSMLMNFSANMLGLDNAATPLGLKAMSELQEVNEKKDTASNAQIMFIVMNTSGMTIIPVSIMAMRAANGALNPADVFIPLLLATFTTALTGIIAVSVYQKINLFNRVILAYIGGLMTLIGLLIWYLSGLPPEKIGTISRFSGSFLIISLITFFIILAIRKKINVFEQFIEGAKEGFTVAVKIIPYLVAMLVAIGLFRASGGLDVLIGLITKFFSLFNMNTDFVGALPVALMKPLSGSGARGMMVEAMQTYGVDSFTGRLACIFQGTTETTFYAIALYFGSVNIIKTRYAIKCALIADAVGMTAAVFIGYLFF